MGIHRTHLTRFLQVFSDQIGRWFRSAVLVVLLGLSPAPISLFAQEEEPSESPSVVVLVSAYKPFLEAVEGLSSILETAGVEVELFTLEDYPERRRDVLRERMIQKNIGCYIGVGPWAADFIWHELDRPEIPAIYSIVVDPEKRLPRTRDLCGISINIPVSTQVEEIAAALPDTKRIGLLYDPLFNDPFLNQAKEIAEKLGRRIIPLQVSSDKDIPEILGKNLLNVDALWLIMDETVSYERIGQYIIETALKERIPVIGYNSFHHESGAALSFIFDYEVLGKQTGQLVLDVLHGRICRSPDPDYSVQVNHKVIERLDIRLGEEVLREGMAQP